MHFYTGHRPYEDPGMCVCVGGGGVQACLPEKNPDNFLVLNFNILHFTVI